MLGAHLSFEWVETLRRGALQGSNEKDIWVLNKDGGVLLGRSWNIPLFSRACGADAGRAIRRVRNGWALARICWTGFAVVDGRGGYPALNWIVVAQQDASVAFALPTRVGATILVIGGCVMVVSVFLTVLISRRISRHLSALTEVADEIGRNPQGDHAAGLRGSVEVIRVSGSLRALLRRLGSAELRFVEHAQRYQQDMADLRRLADSDPLTGLMNRRSFLTSPRPPCRARAAATGWGIIMGDIDHFKLVNDTYGHPAGGRGDPLFGNTFSATLRAKDRVARFGGEEFVVTPA